MKGCYLLQRACFFFILYPQGRNVTEEVVKKVEPFEHALEEVIKYINTTSKVEIKDISYM